MNSTWVMKQTWEHVLFLHWAIAPEQVQPLLPKELELDTFAGSAWVSILPFLVCHQRVHFLPEIPLMRTYLELNVRTYVKYKGTPGVYFLGLDANHLPSVLGARMLALPYRLAQMEMERKQDLFCFSSRQVLGDGRFSVSFRPVGDLTRTVSGSLDSWLLERYCLFTKWGPLILRGGIRHDSWEVSKAEVQLLANSAAPFSLASKPDLVHYASKKDAFVLPLKKG